VSRAVADHVMLTLRGVSGETIDSIVLPGTISTSVLMRVRWGPFAYLDVRAEPANAQMAKYIAEWKG
jgi:hypothetical protein